MGTANMKRTSNPLDKETALKVYTRDQWTCRNLFCQSKRNLTPHHIVKRSLGGKDETSNLLTLCVSRHRRNEDGVLKIWFDEDGKSLRFDDRKLGLGMIVDRATLDC